MGNKQDKTVLILFKCNYYNVRPAEKAYARPLGS